MVQEDMTICPYCGHKMSRWESPATASWGSDHQYICFNDDCPYYQRGWDHTFKKIGIKASYRHRYDPNTGQTGPFPVNTAEAGREHIVEE